MGGLAWQAHYENGPPLRAPSTALSLSSSSRCCGPPPLPAAMDPASLPPFLPSFLPCLLRVWPRTLQNLWPAFHHRNNNNSRKSVRNPSGMQQHWECWMRRSGCTCWLAAGSRGGGGGGGGAVDHHHQLGGGGVGVGLVRFQAEGLLRLAQ